MYGNTGSKDEANDNKRTFVFINKFYHAENYSTEVKPMKVATYLRVSSSEQTAGNQIPALQVFAKKRGWQIVEVYSENESAWRNGQQKELARLLTDLRSGKRKYDYLLVWALDRLSRQGIATVFERVD